MGKTISEQLANVKLDQHKLRIKIMNDKINAKILNHYNAAAKRVILLDTMEHSRPLPAYLSEQCPAAIAATAHKTFIGTQE